ncbi:hypothetical protein JOF56_004124 [Kibdelosporangium banguiense]|uniref:Uncharacterized protein n=1 Tax=Kibdelosporangium banguiense TaxID=1365924 RepID=A0ABS4TI97_9PSEU|nr:hypothetical protein [Kibdelosporangium banguiense]MBP2323739.1 hypothetical protein [Kibdelosporangium banguiense]
MTHVLAAVLRDAMINRLASLDSLSRKASASTELGNLTSAMREILDLHQPDSSGRCRGCPGWRRNRRFPCPVWLIAHRHLLVPADPLGNSN